MRAGGSTAGLFGRRGEVWKDSDAYWQDHLPLLAKAADLAHTAILTELRHPHPEE